MLFYIAPSVAEGLELGDLETIDFVSRLIDSRKRGLLLIHASKLTYARLMGALKVLGRESESALFATLAKRQREMRALVRDLTKLVYVTRFALSPRSFGGKFIVSSPILINRTGYLYYPVVLAENVSDSVLYLTAIAENYQIGLPISMKEVSIRGRRRMGGGNTTHVQYSEIKLEGLELCICIVDSDRKCPDERIGETAQLVVDSDDLFKSAACANLVVDVYSAENLLPLHEIKRIYSKGKSAEQIAAFDIVENIRPDESWRFLPLKKGISSDDIRGVKAHSVYWRARLAELGMNIECCKDVSCSCILVPAVGTKTLVEALANKDSDWYRALKDEVNVDVRSVYAKVARELKSWCCVGSEMRAS